MSLIQIGVPLHQKDTTFRWSAAGQTVPFSAQWQITQAPGDPGGIRFVPDLSIHLVFDLTGLVDIEPFLVCTGGGFVDLTLSGGVDLLGIQLPVWEALRLRQAPLAETDTCAVTIDADWAHLIYFDLPETRNAGARSDQPLELASELERLVECSLTREFGAHFLDVSVGRETPGLPFSQRHERRLYRELTGLSPTGFRRVVRFQEALQRIRAEGALSWDEYYDQTHFTREFKAFTGLTPAVYVRRYVR